MKRVLVIGSSGMVASRFIDLASDKLDIEGADEKTLDITDNNAVRQYFDLNKFDCVINFAAFTNVDGAEKERGQEGFVWKLNVEGPRNLIEVCKKKDIFLIHISTDFVFPGDSEFPGPYSETDTPLDKFDKRMGWYGWTKRIAEKDILESGIGTAIVRYGYPFRAATFDLKNDWARNLIKLYNEGKLYPLFTDQVQSILFIDDLVTPLVKIVDNKLSGIFHIASKDTTTPYESGKYLLEKMTGNSVDIQNGSMEEFLKASGRTPRPLFGGLTTNITEEKLEMKFKTWREMVDEFIKQSRS
jgi:dTDP-4-dehydrorhamnose reductase